MTHFSTYHLNGVILFLKVIYGPAFFLDAGKAQQQTKDDESLSKLRLQNQPKHKQAQFEI